MAAKSQLVPKEYRNQPEDIMLAVQLGSEVGLRPMQALQNIAVINGRPAVWGDALPGLCKASPVYDDIIETCENEHEPDQLVAVCIAKRHGSTPRHRALLRDGRQARRPLDQGGSVADLPATDAADARPQLRPPRRLPRRAQGPLDNHAGADQPAPPTIDAIAEPAPSASPPAPPRAYQLTTKQGTTTFPTGEE